MRIRSVEASYPGRQVNEKPSPDGPYDEATRDGGEDSNGGEGMVKKMRAVKKVKSVVSNFKSFMVVGWADRRDANYGCSSEWSRGRTTPATVTGLSIRRAWVEI